MRRPDHDLLLTRAGWPAVADHLLAGLVHDLKGRATSLVGMVQLLSLEDPASAISPFLDQEVKRLEEVIRLLGLLVGEAGIEREPLDPAEFLPPLVELHRRYRGLEAVTTVLELDDPPPIVANWTTVGRTLLVLLAHVGHAAERRRGTLRVRAGGHQAGGLSVEIRMTDISPGRADPGSSVEPDPTTLEALTDLVGGTLDASESPEGPQLRIDFPPVGPRSG